MFLHWCVTVNVTVILDIIHHCFLPTAYQKLGVSNPGWRLAHTDVTCRNFSFLTPHDRNTSSFWSDSRSWRRWTLSFYNNHVYLIWSLQILQKIEYASKWSVLCESVVIVKWIYFCLSTGTMFYKITEYFLYCFSRHSNFIAQKAYIYWCIPWQCCCAQGNNKRDMLYSVIFRHTDVQFSIT